jgi:hypothetical protein
MDLTAVALLSGSIGCVAAMLVTTVSVAQPQTSTCYGTYWNGRMEGSVQLPLEGKNFRTYSKAGSELGRTYVHSAVHDIVLAAYAGAEKLASETLFVYGETALKQGGPFPPHRTHQTGLSVDFFVPVRDAAGRPAALPISPTNKWGYDIAFDAIGRLGDLTIDFDALAEHLYAAGSESATNRATCGDSRSASAALAPRDQTRPRHQAPAVHEDARVVAPRQSLPRRFHRAVQANGSKQVMLRGREEGFRREHVGRVAHRGAVNSSDY